MTGSNRLITSDYTSPRAFFPRRTRISAVSNTSVRARRTDRPTDYPVVGQVVLPRSGVPLCRRIITATLLFCRHPAPPPNVKLSYSRVALPWQACVIDGGDKTGRVGRRRSTEASPVSMHRKDSVFEQALFRKSAFIKWSKQYLCWRKKKEMFNVSWFTKDSKIPAFHNLEVLELSARTSYQKILIFLSHQRQRKLTTN